MMKILRSLVDDLGKTIIIVIHDINIARINMWMRLSPLKMGNSLQGTTEQIMKKETLDSLY